jgi:Leucine-rich repeat (LRR) protein
MDMAQQYTDIHKHYIKITECFPTIFKIYSSITEKFIFLGDLFYAFVLQKHLDLDTLEITEEIMLQYLDFYNSIEKLNITNMILSQEDETYKTEINQITHLYNDYFMNHRGKFNYNAPEINLDFSRFMNIKEVLVSDILIRSIQNISNQVKIIHITHCGLEMIDRLPYSLEYINISNNRLKQLPNMHLSHSLQTLICNYNSLIRLPLGLPDSIIQIYCNHNKLTELPILPRRLRILFCNNNRITRLSVLPKQLIRLYCGHNQIRNLPCMTEMNQLKILFCNNNLIEELPPMPCCLQEISHQNNPIRNFFPFPTGVLVV